MNLPKYTLISNPWFVPPENYGDAYPMPPAQTKFHNQRFSDLEVEFDAQTRACWCYMKPAGRPSFTPGLLRDLDTLQQAIKKESAEARANADKPVQYFVLASKIPGIFNLGGDLTLLARHIRSQNRHGLMAYARACIDVLHSQRRRSRRAADDGRAGAGRRARRRVRVRPRLRFRRGRTAREVRLPGNPVQPLFPGMGAYSLLSRRLDAARAERMILSVARFMTPRSSTIWASINLLAEAWTGRDGAARVSVRARPPLHAAMRGLCSAPQGATAALRRVAGYRRDLGRNRAAASGHRLAQDGASRRGAG
jgi:hypothetical protein